MNRKMRAELRSTGFSLVELMIAMVLGLFLIGGSLTIFSANLRSAELGQAVASLQAGARFAMDTMATDLRSAGYRGCAAPEDSILSVSVTGADVGLFGDDVLGGSLIGGTAWSPAPPGGYVPLAASGTTRPAGLPVSGTHALVVQYAGAPGNALASTMNSPADSLTLIGTNPAFVAGEFAVLSDCESVDVFRIGTLGGSAGAQIVDPDESLSRRYVTRTDYPGSTRVFPLVGAIYYIGETGRSNATGDTIRALYLQSLPFDAANNPPVELLEGVDQLQLTFGITDGGGNTRFVAPDDASVEPTAIDMVKVGLLMSSIEPLLDAPGNRVFHLAGRAVGPKTITTPDDTPSYTADRRLRVPYGTTIRVRNRNLGT